MDALLAQPPSNFGPKRCFWQATSRTQVVYKFCSTCACVTTATVCFERKSNICIAKFGNLGANEVKGSKFLVENVIFRIADPDLPIHYATFMELR